MLSKENALTIIKSALKNASYLKHADAIYIIAKEENVDFVDVIARLIQEQGTGTILTEGNKSDVIEMDITQSEIEKDLENQENPELPAYAILNGELIIREAAPNLSSPRTGRLPKGTRIRVVEKMPDSDGYSWYKIEYNYKDEKYQNSAYIIKHNTSTFKYVEQVDWTKCPITTPPVSKLYFNPYNIGATGTGSAVIRNATEYARKRDWDSFEKGLRGGIKLVKENYKNKIHHILKI